MGKLVYPHMVPVTMQELLSNWDGNRTAPVIWAPLKVSSLRPKPDPESLKDAGKVLQFSRKA